MTLSNIIIVLIVLLAILPVFNFKYRDILLISIGFAAIWLTWEDNSVNVKQKDTDYTNIAQLIRGRKLDSINNGKFYVDFIQRLANHKIYYNDTTGDIRFPIYTENNNNFTGIKMGGTDNKVSGVKMYNTFKK